MRPATGSRRSARTPGDADARGGGEGACPSLLGMAVDYRPGWDGHDARRKIGLLTEANLIGQRLVVQRISLRAGFSGGGRGDSAPTLPRRWE